MPAVQYLDVSIETLRPNTFNPNRVSAENERKIRASIQRNGIFKPIVVREVAGVAGYEIIGGQHRWEQARELGHDTVPIANLGQITDSRAKEICLVDNARYGSDDTLTLSDILKEIGDIQEIQEFLPYGDTDLAAIFSVGNIDLSTLNIPENDDVLPESAPDDAPTAKPAKTHTIMRFKVSNQDAERLTALIAKTQNLHDYRHEDQLTNAGDALVHLLSSQLPSIAAAQQADAEDWDNMLSEIEKMKEDQQ